MLVGTQQPATRTGLRRFSVDASILLLTKNEEQHIGAILDCIFRQRTSRSFQVVLIDSGSIDQTLAIAEKYPLEVHRIPPHSFHHSRTRNMAARLATGEYLVYLAGDAVPCGEDWLEWLLASFSDLQVGAAYGRQIGRRDSTDERHDVFDAIYGSDIIVKEGKRKRELGYRYYLFSTVNSAIRADVWRETGGFPEELKVFEDVGIGKKILDSGWKIVYDPRATVVHGHNHSGGALFKRYFDIGVTYNRLGLWDKDTKRSMFRDGMRVVFRTVRSSGSPKNRQARDVAGAAQTIFNHATKYTALLLGRNERFLPVALKRHFSAFRLFE